MHIITGNVQDGRSRSRPPGKTYLHVGRDNATNPPPLVIYLTKLTHDLAKYNEVCRNEEKDADGAVKMFKHARAYEEFLTVHGLPPCDPMDDMARQLTKFWTSEANNAWGQPPVAPPVPVMSLSETNAARTA